MAPISLAILNPMSFVLMEAEKRRRPAAARLSINSEDPSEDSNTGSAAGAREQLKMIASVARNIFLNPVITMTILGILGNLIFSHQVPNYLGRILEVEQFDWNCNVKINVFFPSGFRFRVFSQRALPVGPEDGRKSAPTERCSTRSAWSFNHRKIVRLTP